MQKQHVQLTDSERSDLLKITKAGTTKARTIRRAFTLLQLDEGQTITAVAETTKVTNSTVSALKKRYNHEGLTCLYDAPRSGRPVTFTGEDRAKVTALACSQPPEGYSQWSLRLLADKVVELLDADSISHTQVGDILKKTL